MKTRIYETPAVKGLRERRITDNTSSGKESVHGIQSQEY